VQRVTSPRQYTSQKLHVSLGSPRDRRQLIESSLVGSCYKDANGVSSPQRILKDVNCRLEVGARSIENPHTNDASRLETTPGRESWSSSTSSESDEEGSDGDDEEVLESFNDRTSQIYSPTSTSSSGDDSMDDVTEQNAMRSRYFSPQTASRTLTPPANSSPDFADTDFEPSLLAGEEISQLSSITSAPGVQDNGSKPEAGIGLINSQSKPSDLRQASSSPLQSDAIRRWLMSSGNHEKPKEKKLNGIQPDPIQKSPRKHQTQNMVGSKYRSSPDGEEDIFSGLEEDTDTEGGGRTPGPAISRQSRSPQFAPSRPPSRLQQQQQATMSPKVKQNDPKEYEDIILDKEKLSDVKSELTSSLISGKGSRRSWFQHHRGVKTIEEEHPADEEEGSYVYSVPRKNDVSPASEDLLDDSAVVNMMSAPKVSTSNNNDCQMKQPDPTAFLTLGYSLVDSIANACRLPSKCSSIVRLSLKRKTKLTPSSVLLIISSTEI